MAALGRIKCYGKNCDALASQTRLTQFAGEHYLCDACAAEHDAAQEAQFKGEQTMVDLTDLTDKERQHAEAAVQALRDAAKGLFYIEDEDEPFYLDNVQVQYIIRRSNSAHPDVVAYAFEKDEAEAMTNGLFLAAMSFGDFCRLLVQTKVISRNTEGELVSVWREGADLTPYLTETFDKLRNLG